MAKNAYTFFGTEITDMGLGESAATWFGSHGTLWEKGGRLYRFYMDKAGSSSEARVTGMQVDHGVETSDGQYLFVFLVLNWARDDDYILQKLDNNDDEPYGLTRNLLLAASLAEKRREQQNSLDLRMVRLRRPTHPAMRFLEDPKGVNPEKTQYWGAWGMPNGQIVVGPWSKVMAELDGLRRSSWHNLSNYQRSHLVTTLVRFTSGDEVARDVRIAGLKAFHDSMSGYDIDNQRSNVESWAAMYFGLEDDPLALPWV